MTVMFGMIPTGSLTTLSTITLRTQSVMLQTSTTRRTSMLRMFRTGRRTLRSPILVLRPLLMRRRTSKPTIPRTPHLRNLPRRGCSWPRTRTTGTQSKELTKVPQAPTTPLIPVVIGGSGVCSCRRDAPRTPAFWDFLRPCRTWKPGPHCCAPNIYTGTSVSGHGYPAHQSALRPT